MIYALNLDRTHELDVTIGLEDCVEDLGFMPNLCVHIFSEKSRLLSSILSDDGHVYNYYD